MKIVTPPLIVKENDAFENDALNRKAYGEALLNLIERSSDELVISLDGKWGEGKTTFVKMWQGLLSDANVPNLYIDAFANDYVDDAFVSVASAITRYAELNIGKGNNEKITDLKNKTKKVGGQLLSWSAKIGIKAVTLGVIKDSDLEELKDIKGDLAKDVSGLIGDFIEERLNSHLNDVELIQSFKELLSEIPSKLEDNDNKPLVIIIDELDRCKPTYAVEVMEKVKHLFSVENIVFVLVMHKEQLEEAVRCVYGQNIDAHTYLQKFITLETKIPKRTGDTYSSDISKYCRKLLQLHDFDTWGDDQTILDFVDLLANHFYLSLRQLEKVFTNITIFYAVSREDQIRVVPIIAFLSIIKVINPQLFDKLLHQRISFKDLCSETGLTNFIKEQENDQNLHWLMMWMQFALLTEKEFQQLDQEDRIRKFEEILWKYSVRSREMLIPIFSHKISMFIVR